MHQPKKLSLDPKSKRAVLATARKAQTHMANVIRMIEEDRYCIDVLQQALAVQGLWKRVIRGIFSNHIRTCFQDEVCKNGKSKERAVDEVIRVMELADRS